MLKLAAAAAIAGLAIFGAAVSAQAAKATFNEGTCPGWGTPVCKKWSCTGPVTAPSCTCVDSYCKVNGTKAGLGRASGLEAMSRKKTSSN